MSCDSIYWQTMFPLGQAAAPDYMRPDRRQRAPYSQSRRHNQISVSAQADTARISNAQNAHGSS